MGCEKVEVVDSIAQGHSRIQVEGHSSISLLYFQKLLDLVVMSAGKGRLGNCRVFNCLNQKVKYVTLLTRHWPVLITLPSQQRDTQSFMCLPKQEKQLLMKPSNVHHTYPGGLKGSSEYF